MGKNKSGRAFSQPLIPLRGITVFPVMSFSFDIGREKSVKALEEAITGDETVFLVSQRDPAVEEPGIGDVYEYGVIVEIKQLLRISGDMLRALGEGVKKAKIVEITGTEPFLTAKVVEIKDTPYEENEYSEALARTAIELYEEYAKLAMNQTPESIYSIITETNLHTLCDMISANVSVKYTKKQQLLEMTDAIEKANVIIQMLENENSVLEIQRGIYIKVRSSVEKNQKEYYLKEQLKAIEDELGEKGDETEAEKYIARLKTLKLPLETHEKLLKDMERFSKMQPHSSDYSVMCNYFDTVLELPWSTKTRERASIKRVEAVLERDHYGLKKVKERIIEYIAVRNTAGKGEAPILCFSGPPGTGKTSIAKSIAEALNRKYVRVSLGGVRDEAEIRGHRRTYVGAMPGRIINAMRQAKSNNPVILLDEIDKISSDFRGDPSSALLEALDMEQNAAFRDHYLDIPFDLSNVLFICTANRTDTILPALRDRLEIIEVSGYTEDEKLAIAKKHLLPKQLKKHGLEKRQLKISDGAFLEIINGYTKESGVRQLERRVAEICRKSVLTVMKGERASISVTEESLEKFLGIPKYRHDKKLEKPAVGVAKGLAVTGAGGETLLIEVNTMKGTGKFELTGNMGDVMKESAKAAISYIRSHASQFAISEKFYKDTDIHIHIPEGAVPKDGPSAGVTMAAAMVSALTGEAVSNDVAMTGEITIRGNVLPVGGLKEKLLAAKRSGITKITAPIGNMRDIEEIPQEVRQGLDIMYVEYMEQVLENVLVKRGRN